MPKLTRPAGAFVTKDDVSTGDIVTFIDHGEEKIKKDFHGKDKLGFQITVTLPDGEEKIFDLNNTSKRNMMDHYGEDSDAWIGKVARVEVSTQKIGNEFKDVVYLTAPNKNLKGDIINA
jgi:hypothetical protein